MRSMVQVVERDDRRGDFELSLVATRNWSCTAMPVGFLAASYGKLVTFEIQKIRWTMMNPFFEGDLISFDGLFNATLSCLNRTFSMNNPYNYLEWIGPPGFDSCRLVVLPLSQACPSEHLWLATFCDHPSWKIGTAPTCLTQQRNKLTVYIILYLFV